MANTAGQAVVRRGQTALLPPKAKHEAWLAEAAIDPVEVSCAGDEFPKVMRSPLRKIFKHSLEVLSRRLKYRVVPLGLLTTVLPVLILGLS